MALRHNMEEFRQRSQAISAAVELEWRAKAVRLGQYAYERLVEATEDTDSVDTGAYRAEHVVEQGGGYLFEHPDRVGPDRVLPSQKALGLGPLIGGVDSDAVGDALDQGLQTSGFSFVNRRFYADRLENGDSQIEPRQIYARAFDAALFFAELLVQEPPTRPELRRVA